MANGFKNYIRLIEISPGAKVKVIFARNQAGELIFGKPVKLVFETVEDAFAAKMLFSAN